MNLIYVWLFAILFGMGMGAMLKLAQYFLRIMSE